MLMMRNFRKKGTGTGIWAINFARLHPQAHVIGTDLSLIQPPTLPPNCEFIRDDIEDPWAFQTPFDFVHLRMMFTCFQNPKHVMQTIYDNLEPGGWVEYQDTGLEIVGENAASEEYIRASKLTQWADIFKVGMLKTTGRDIGISRKYQSWMTEIGFVDVTEKPILVPINSWPLDPDDQFIGHFSRRNVGKVVESSFKFLLAGGMTEAELPSFQDDVKWCLGDTMMRGFWIGRLTAGLRFSFYKFLSTTSRALHMCSNTILQYRICCLR